MARAQKSKYFTRLDEESDVANGRPLGAGIRKAERVNVDNGHVAETLTAVTRGATEGDGRDEINLHAPSTIATQRAPGARHRN